VKSRRQQNRRRKRRKKGRRKLRDSNLKRRGRRKLRKSRLEFKNSNGCSRKRKPAIDISPRNKFSLQLPNTCLLVQASSIQNSPLCSRRLWEDMGNNQQAEMKLQWKIQGYFRLINQRIKKLNLSKGASKTLHSKAQANLLYQT